MSNFKFPTEVIDLPSKGLLYPENSPLAKGQIEMKYMTAKEEDILTNPNYLKRGVTIDKLLESLIVDKSINYEDLIVGDQNAIMVAARILGYGKEYSFEYKGETQVIDLTELEDKVFDESLVTPHLNEFHFTLPKSKLPIIFKILSVGDDNKIKKEIQGYQKINKDSSPELSTRLKYMLLEIDGNRDPKAIREFVDTAFLAQDSRALREYVKQVQPNINLNITLNTKDGQEDISLPITANFFWPDI